MFRAKVEGMSSKNFLGVPPDPSFIVPCCIFVLSVRQVLISKTSGATWGLVYLECLGSGNSIGPHPDHSHLYCHTQIYLVCKNFRRKISPVCTSHTLQTGCLSRLGSQFLESIFTNSCPAFRKPILYAFKQMISISIKVTPWGCYS